LVMIRKMQKYDIEYADLPFFYRIKSYAFYSK